MTLKQKYKKKSTQKKKKKKMFIQKGSKTLLQKPNIVDLHKLERNHTVAYVKNVFTPECDHIRDLLFILIWNISTTLSSKGSPIAPPKLQINEDSYIIMFPITTNTDIDISKFVEGLFRGIKFDANIFLTSFDPVNGIIVSISKKFTQKLFKSSYRSPRIKNVCTDVVGFKDISQDMLKLKSIIYDIFEIMKCKSLSTINRSQKSVKIKRGNIEIVITDIPSGIILTPLHEMLIDGKKISSFINGFEKKITIIVEVGPISKKRERNIEICEDEPKTKKIKKCQQIRKIQL